MDLAYELFDLVRTLDRAADRVLSTQGLSWNRYLALVVLSEHEGLTVRMLAGAIGISEPSTSNLVRKLVDAGFIDNSAPAGAGNVRHLTVTPTGIVKKNVCSKLLGDSLDDNAIRIGIDPGELAGTIRRLHDEVRAPAASAAEGAHR
ncbi:MarR family winged helix-turn-helix transcriptional regulator [Gordonia sp. NPDC003422]